MYRREVHAYFSHLRLYFNRCFLFEFRDKLFLQVDLPEPLEPQNSISVEVEEVFSHKMKPFPTKIGQSDKQQVVYEGNHYVYTPYSTRKQSTTVKLASSAVESHTKLKPTSLSDSTISYGPYSDIRPLRHNQMRLHFENNSPFLTVSINSSMFQYSQTLIFMGCLPFYE